MKIIFRLFLVLLISFGLFVPSVFAKDSSDKNIVVLTKTEVVNKDYFNAGDNVTISGTINGDAFVAGGVVLVDGTINGDLFTAGGTVDIRGSVLHDIRAAGGNVNIGGMVGGNVLTAGGNVRIEDKAKVLGSIIVGGGMVDILGPVGKGITVGAGNLRIGNSVGGDITAGADQLFLENGANVKGTITYWSEDEANIADDATVSGKLTRITPPIPKTKDIDGKKIGMAVFWAILAVKLVEFFGVFLLGALLLTLASKYATQTIDTIKGRPWASLGIGFVATIIAPIALIFLFVSGVGIPLAVVMLSGIVVLVFVVKIYGAFLLGGIVLSFFKIKSHILVTLLLGWVLAFILGFIPVLGGIVLAVVSFITLGGILLAKQKTYKLLRSKGLI